MKNMRIVTLAASLLALAAIGTLSLFAQPPVQTERNRLKPFMQQKLDYSKTLLEGLALEDFDKIAQSAQSLSLLSMESQWNTITTEEYLKQSSDFQRTVALIRDAAEEKNLDRATLGYMQLAVRCVECHKYVRKQR